MKNTIDQNSTGTPKMANPTQSVIHNSSLRSSNVLSLKSLDERFLSTLDDILIVHTCTEEEKSLIKSYFNNKATIEKFLRVEANLLPAFDFIGLYSLPIDIAGENSSGLDRRAYFNEIMKMLLYQPNHPAILLDGSIVHNENDLLDTLYHEVDHFIFHILTILRKYENYIQYVSYVESDFFCLQIELFGHYHSANFTTGRIQDGATWRHVYEKSAGGRHRNRPDVYGKVAIIVPELLNYKHRAYNLILNHFGTDRSAQNSMAAIKSPGQRIFHDFCNAISTTIFWLEDEKELKEFMEFLKNLTQEQKNNNEPFKLRDYASFKDILLQTISNNRSNCSLVSSMFLFNAKELINNISMY